MSTQPKPCFCDSRNTFANCCQPILNNQQTAQTAELLMRSRFSAFCSANIDYLIATHHPSKRQANDHQELAETISHCEWLQLKIVDTKQGQPSDAKGEVEFIATYTQQGQPSRLHERSRFVQEEGQWFYLDGEILEANNKLSLGRNDPCYCGSGKKFKKCCGP